MTGDSAERPDDSIIYGSLLSREKSTRRKYIIGRPSFCEVPDTKTLRIVAVTARRRALGNIALLLPFFLRAVSWLCPG